MQRQWLYKRLISLLFLLVAPFFAACIETPFYVSSSSPSEAAEEVSRSTAPTLTFIADGLIQNEYLNGDYFQLEDLGKDYKPSTPSTTSGASPGSSNSASSKSDDKSSDKPKDGSKSSDGDKAASDDAKSDGANVDGSKKSSEKNKKENSLAAGTSGKVPAAIYVMNQRSGVGEQNLQMAYEVVVSPINLLQPNHTYRLTVNKGVRSRGKESSTTNQLQTDFSLTFKTSSSPEEGDLKLDRLIPPLKLVEEGALDNPAASPVVNKPADGTQEKDAVVEEDKKREEDKKKAPEESAKKIRSTPIDVDRTVYVHPAQDFRIRLSAPIGARKLAQAIRLKRDLTAGSEGDNVVDVQLILIDSPTNPEQRFFNYLIRPQEELLVQKRYLLMIGRKTIRLLVDTEQQPLQNELLGDEEYMIGLDDLKLIKRD
jgi:hypothetical protein